MQSALNIRSRLSWIGFFTFALMITTANTAKASGIGLLDRIVLHPSTDPVASTGVRKVLPSGIEVWVYTNHTRHAPHPVQKNLFMIHFIGNASRAEREVPEVIHLFPKETDVVVWSVNYPGYGGSKGSATLTSLAPAALDVYDQIAQEAKGAPIWVSSFSIGTLSSLYLAKERPVHALVLRNPVPLKELILRDYSWASWIVSDIPKELDSIVNAGYSHSPALFLSSEKDEMIHPSLHQKIMDAFSGKYSLVVLPGAKHNDRIPEVAYPAIQENLIKLGG